VGAPPPPPLPAPYDCAPCSQCSTGCASCIPFTTSSSIPDQYLFNGYKLDSYLRGSLPYLDACTQCEDGYYGHVDDSVSLAFGYVPRSVCSKASPRAFPAAARAHVSCVALPVVLNPRPACLQCDAACATCVGPAANDCAPRPNTNTIACADNYYQSNVTQSLCTTTGGDIIASGDQEGRKLLQSVNETATTCTAVSPRAAACLARPEPGCLTPSALLCPLLGVRLPHHSRGLSLTPPPTPARSAPPPPCARALPPTTTARPAATSRKSAPCTTTWSATRCGMHGAALASQPPSVPASP
jgi:hypothetical protein